MIVKPEDRIVDDLDLWLYVTQSPFGYNQSLVDVKIVYGKKKYFHNIRSKQVCHCIIATGVLRSRGERTAYGMVMAKAVEAMEDFNWFLRGAIGTADKRSRKYKRFMEDKKIFKSYVMKRRMEE